jgi:[pyruvate, phosphate dikinase]-phosphate phosphotransferase / [pyruvate, phosphate dikinase] kinase
MKPSCRLTVDRAHAAGLGIFAIMSTAPRCTAGALRARASPRYAAHDLTFVPALRSIAPRGKGNHRRLVVWRAESSRPPEQPARDTSEQDNVDARIRAERMAVRLKLASTAGAKKTTTGGRLNSSAATSFDAKIAEAEATASSNKSKVIEEERAAVRARMGKFRMNRYAFVNTGANAGGVYDRVTGEAAPVNDETFAIEDRVDLARERVKQAQQELVNAKAARDAKERDLNDRVAKLEKLAEELATKRKEESAGEDGGKSAERKAILATMKEMQGDSSSPSTTAAGAGAAKIAVATSTTTQTTGVESKDPKDAKARAADAIRARASSSLSRLRKHRKSRLSQASSLRKKPVTSTAAVETSTVAEHDPLRDAAASTASAAKEEDESLGSTNSRGAPTTPTVPGSNDVLPKPIFVLSDSTGESAANTCRAALGQFEELLNLAMPTNLYIFRFLDDPSDAYKIVRQAAEDDALVVYTLSAPEMVTSVMTACKLYKVESVNLWGPLLESMEAHLMMTRMGVPITETRGVHQLAHFVGGAQHGLLPHDRGGGVHAADGRRRASR